MSSTVNGADGSYRNPVTVRFTHGSIRVVLDQGSAVAPHEAEEIGIQADRLTGHLVAAAFRVGTSISDYVAKHNPTEGVASTEGAAWQTVDGLHVRARVTVETNRSIPEFVLAEAVDLVLAGFRVKLRDEMDPSYKAYLAEEEAREAAKCFEELLSDPAAALTILSALLGEDVPLGADGSAGMMVGRAFGPFGRSPFGGGFAQG